MSFHPISTTVGGAKAWNESGPGVYAESTVQFGQPRSYLKITRGTPNNKTGLTTCSISRILERDVTVNGVVSRKALSVSLQISVPNLPDFTTVQVDDAAGLISEFLTSATLDRILKGEQ